MSKLKETDIGRLMIDHLTKKYPDSELFKEVRIGGIGSVVVDLVRKTGDSLHAIELKTTLGLAVMQQAHYNKGFFNLSSIAVPAPRGNKGPNRCIGSIGWR